MQWFINIGGTISSIIVILHIIFFLKYKFIDKSSTLKINIYSTLTEHYKEALRNNPEYVREYFLKTFPIDRAKIIPNEFISEKRKNILAEIILTNPNNLAVIVGSEEYDIKILNIYDSENNKIIPLEVQERRDTPNKNQEEIKKGQIILNKGDYISILTQEFGYESSQKIEIEVKGHKEIIVLTPNQRHGSINYIKAKNTIKSYFIKYVIK